MDTAVPDHVDSAGYVLLVNEAAGSAQTAAVDQASDVLQAAGADVVRATCADPSDVDTVVAELGARTLVVCGGDGSLHVAVTCLRAAGRLDAPVALVPLGTGNDFARALGLPLEDPSAAARHLLAAAPRPIDLLEGVDGVCVNALHVGLGASAAARAEALKSSLSELAYPVGALLAGLTEAGIDLTVEVDGQRVVADSCLLVAVCNGPGFGGGTLMAPDAVPTDGCLDVVVVRATGPIERAAFGVALQRGSHLERDDVEVVRGRTVTIRGADLREDVDGELGERSDAPRTWQVAPGAWRFRG